MFGLDGSKVLGLGLTAKVWAWIAAGALVLALAVFGAGYGFGHGAGKASGLKEWQETKDAWAKEKAAAQKALADANDRNRQLERKHEQEVADIRAQYAATQAAEAAVDAERVADYRAGTDRIRLPVRTCGTAVASAADAAAARADAEARAELAPETSAALYGIAADGDAAIRQLTGLQTWAESAVKLCNAPPPKS